MTLLILLVVVSAALGEMVLFEFEFEFVLDEFDRVGTDQDVRVVEVGDDEPVTDRVVLVELQQDLFHGRVTRQSRVSNVRVSLCKCVSVHG